MKIAVASEGAAVAGHFGHCSDFNFFTIADGKIANSERISNPGGCGYLPTFLKEQGVNVVIAGGMGAGPKSNLNNMGIEVILGAQGNAEDVVKIYIQGNLESKGSTCAGHHDGDCNEGGHGNCGNH
ncbi:MAG: NifB/NifX family molybdenum-iron cluster-binding protein [Anaerovoracaceae bacterium]|jgi:predicted Fe-Mo cluster-binding NifX family protein